MYEDFYNYQSGVYEYVTGDFVGGHAIKVLGWGISPSGAHYWLCANSWGSSWGMNGYFMMKQGDFSGMDDNMIACKPKI